MSSSKRHFTAVIGKKEQGSYTSSSPSSAARKAVSKLCADDKNRKVEFYMRETTQSSEKKVYGMYMGYMEKLKKPIELKGRVIRYKPVAKLLKNKKMKGGSFKEYDYWYQDRTKGKKYKDQLRKIFEGRFTEDAPVDPSNNSFRHATTFNKLNQAKKNMSGKFLINDMGVQIADNFPNFEKVQTEIIQAFRDLNIDYDHNPEEDVEEINNS
jgi:hypothetical protein